MPRLSSQELHALRQCVRPELSSTSPEYFGQVMDESLSELPPAAAEDFMKLLGSFGKAAGPAMKDAAPGMAQGAAKGAAVGGPWGALIGAGVGLASSAMRKPGAPPAAQAPAPAATVPEAPATPELPSGQGAAATILGLLQNPTVQQSLLSQVLGSNGREQVRTASGVTLPRAAINSLLTLLLANAAEGLPEAESISEQSYLQGETGEYLVDPASPEQHAALVLSHLQSDGSRSGELMEDSGEFMDSVEWMPEASEDSGSADWQESEESGETVQFY